MGLKLERFIHTYSFELKKYFYDYFSYDLFYSATVSIEVMIRSALYNYQQINCKGKAKLYVASCIKHAISIPFIKF